MRVFTISVQQRFSHSVGRIDIFLSSGEDHPLSVTSVCSEHICDTTYLGMAL
jgi:hypothetical protein